MTAAEIRGKLKEFRDTFPVARDRIIVDSIFSGVALTKRRLNSDRLNQELTIFGIYSPGHLKKRIKKLKDSDPRINFSFTNKMMKSTEPVLIQSTDEVVRVVVEPLDSSRHKVMGYHDKRFGPIIYPSDEEIDVIIDLFVNGIQRHIDESF